MEKRSFFFFLIVWAICFGFVPTFASAQTMALTLAYPPLVISEDNSTTHRGLCTELVLEMARRAGIDLSIQVVPWARAYENALSTPNILLFPLIKSPEREKSFVWICPVNRPIYTVYCLREPHAIPVHNLAEIGTAAIGVVNNAMDHLFLKAQGTVRLDPAVSLESLVNKLLIGRNKFIVAQQSALVYELKSRGKPLTVVEPLFTLKGVVPDGYSWLAVAKGTDPGLISALRAAADSMRQDGSWEKIFSAWQN